MAGERSSGIEQVQDLNKTLEVAERHDLGWSNAVLTNDRHSAKDEILESNLSGFLLRDTITDATYADSFAYMAMTLPHFLFDIFHCDVPWLVSIPVATFVTRSLIYAATWGLSRSSRRRVQTVHAFTLAHKHATSVPQHHEANHPSNIRKIYLHGWRNTIKKRYKAYPLRVTLWNLLNLPIWFATIEALRSMVGTRYGLLGLVCRSLGLSVTEGEVLFPDWIETTMSSEGALWFPDLTVPDPVGGLSIILGLAIARSIYKSMASLRQPSYLYEGGPVRKEWILGAPVIGLIIIPMTLQFPAALLLYWITSTMSVPFIKSVFDTAFPGPISTRVKPLTSGLDNRVSPTWLTRGASTKLQPSSSGRASGSFVGRSRGRM